MLLLTDSFGAHDLEQAACRDQMLVLLQKSLHNKSVATDFAVSFPICIQPSKKNRTCYVLMQNQRRKLKPPQRKTFSTCISCISNRKGARVHATSEQCTCIHKDLNCYKAERGESKAQNNNYYIPYLCRKLSLLKVSIKQLLSSATSTLLSYTQLTQTQQKGTL